MEFYHESNGYDKREKRRKKYNKLKFQKKSPACEYQIRVWDGKFLELSFQGALSKFSMWKYPFEINNFIKMLKKIGTRTSKRIKNRRNRKETDEYENINKN